MDKSPNQAYWDLFGALLGKQINDEIEDFNITKFEKKIVGQDDDGTEVYNIEAECQIIPKKVIHRIEINMTIFPTGTSFKE